MKHASFNLRRKKQGNLLMGFLFFEKNEYLQYLSVFRWTQKLAILTMTGCRKMLACSTPSSSLQVHSTDLVYFDKQKCLLFLLFFPQEQAAILATLIMLAWGRLLMRTAPIWWQTWHTSAGWWLLELCHHPLSTVTSFPQQHTRHCAAAAQDSFSTEKVQVE